MILLVIIMASLSTPLTSSPNRRRRRKMKFSIAASVLMQFLPTASSSDSIPVANLLMGTEGGGGGDEENDDEDLSVSQVSGATGPGGTGKRAHNWRQSSIERIRSSKFANVFEDGGVHTTTLLNKPDPTIINSSMTKKKKDCNPSSDDPDVGFLSCDTGYECIQDEASVLGGFCTSSSVVSRELVDVCAGLGYLECFLNCADNGCVYDFATQTCLSGGSISFCGECYPYGYDQYVCELVVDESIWDDTSVPGVTISREKCNLLAEDRCDLSCSRCTFGDNGCEDSPDICSSEQPSSTPSLTPSSIPSSTPSSKPSVTSSSMPSSIPSVTVCSRLTRKACAGRADCRFDKRQGCMNRRPRPTKKPSGKGKEVCGVRIQTKEGYKRSHPRSKGGGGSIPIVCLYCSIGTMIKKKSSKRRRCILIFTAHVEIQS